MNQEYEQKITVSFEPFQSHSNKGHKNEFIAAMSRVEGVEHRLVTGYPSLPDNPAIGGRIIQFGHKIGRAYIKKNLLNEISGNWFREAAKKSVFFLELQKMVFFLSGQALTLFS